MKSRFSHALARAADLPPSLAARLQLSPLSRLAPLTIACFVLIAPAPSARAALFNPLASSASISHIAPDNFRDYGTTAYNMPGDFAWNLNPLLSPTPSQVTHAYINIPDVSLASAGLSHYTVSGNTGIGNVSLAYETGIGQTDPDQSTFQGPSTLEVAFNMEWDISDGWIGPHFAYQFLGITLATTGLGDISTVAGDFTYEIDVMNEPLDTVDLHYEGLAQDGDTEDFFLFESKLLRATDVPNLGLEGAGKSFLRISGLWTFTALDPQGPSNASLIRDEAVLFDQLIDKIIPTSSTGTQLPSAIYQIQGGGVANINPAFVTPPDTDPTGGAIPEPSTLGFWLASLALWTRRGGKTRG